jgi:hypothetical protein
MIYIFAILRIIVFPNLIFSLKKCKEGYGKDKIEHVFMVMSVAGRHNSPGKDQ